MKDILVTLVFSAIIFVVTGLVDHHFFPRMDNPEARHSLLLESLIDAL